jgi:hypothetical protein
MGLDIYLYKYQDFEKTKKAEDQYSEFSEKLWDSKKKALSWKKAISEKYPLAELVELKLTPIES